MISNQGNKIEKDKDMFKTRHDKNKDKTVDYNDFLTGKKYVNKQWQYC